MSTYMALDWRDAPKPTEIIQRISRVLSDLDQKRVGEVRLAMSNAKGAIKMVQDAPGEPQLVRRVDKFSKRKYSPSQQYWVNFYQVAQAITKMQLESRPLKTRYLQYKEVAPGSQMRLATVKRIVHDLALTIGVHPLALGVLAEGKGEIILPQNTRINATVVTNIIDYNRTKDDSKAVSKFVKKQRIHAPSAVAIPQLVVKLEVVLQQGQQQGPIAVVVTEHKNVSEVLSNPELPLERIILIMTSGYSAQATAEFLHLLSKHSLTKKLPFLWFSNHDYQGIQIWSGLKIGTRASAYASPTMTCPQLEWVGPTLTHLMATPAMFRPQWMEQDRLDYPHKTETERTKDVHAWEAQHLAKLQRKLVPSNSKDKELYRSFQKLGWLANEPVVARELDLMLNGSGKFRFADMAQVNDECLRTYVMNETHAHCQGVLNLTQKHKASNLVKQSPKTLKFKTLPSQSQSQVIKSDQQALLADLGDEISLPSRETSVGPGRLEECHDFDVPL